MTRSRRSLQSHGERSRVYVPVLLRVFNEKYREGDEAVEFTLDDLRAAATALGIVGRNIADVVYRMRSRTKLPPAILEKGFYILRAVGRGRYRLEIGENTIFELPNDAVQDCLDITPLPVRRLLPRDIAEIDEQGLLTMVGYCKLLDHFTGLQVYRLRSHVRKSVASIGQAELDEIDVGVALRDDERPIIFPIEAKAADEAVNRVQIAQMVAFCEEFFEGYDVRPLAIKLDYDGLIQFIEFTADNVPAKLTITKSATYRLNMSPQQEVLFEAAKPAAVTKAREVFGDDE